MPNLEVSNTYPIPNNLIDGKLGKKYNWVPLSHSDETEPYLIKITEEDNIPMGLIPPELVVGEVLRLTRNIGN